MMMVKGMIEATLDDFLEDSDFVMAWIDKNKLGLIDEKNDRVIINVYLLVAEIVIHEFIHYKYPFLNKTGVNKKTRLMLKRMKVEDIVRLTNTIFAICEWAEEGNKE